VPGWYFGQWDRGDRRAALRRAIWRVARSRGYDGPVTTRWYRGMRFNHYFSADMSQCTYVDGRYEPNEMHAIAGILRDGMTFVDVGANQGVFTLLGARLVGPAGSVHAFEPSARDRGRLEANVALNGLRNVKVHPQALGAAAGKAVLEVATAERPGHNTIGGFAYSDTAPAYELDVDVTTLDAAMEEAPVSRLDLLKIDVEGSETSVLRGARKSLARFRPVILAEAQDASLRAQGSSADELVEVLRASGYDVSVFGPSGLPEPLRDQKLDGENLLCTPRSA
jgi:FkbM family methyltransferase